MIRRPLLCFAAALLVTGVLAPPASAAPPPNAPQQVLFGYYGHEGSQPPSATLTWQPPAPVEGGEPVVGYDVLLRVDGGELEVHRVTSTSFEFPLSPGAGVHGNVRAVTETTAGSTSDAPWHGSGAVGLQLAVNRDQHAVYRLTSETIAHSLGNRTFASSPAVARSRKHTLLFVAADSAGVVWGRTLTRDWKRMSPQRCSSPTVSYSGPYGEVLLACVKDGVLVQGSSGPLTDGLIPSITLHSYRSDIVGRPALVGSDIVFRTRGADAAGHNVVALDPYNAIRRLPLRCNGDPGAGEAPWIGDARLGTMVVSCADGRVIRYAETDSSSFIGNAVITRGSALLTFDPLGRPSVWESRDTHQVYLGYIGGDGYVSTYQVHAERWSQNIAVPVRPGISAVSWVG